MLKTNTVSIEYEPASLKRLAFGEGNYHELPPLLWIVGPPRQNDRVLGLQSDLLWVNIKIDDDVGKIAIDVAQAISNSAVHKARRFAEELVGGEEAISIKILEWTSRPTDWSSVGVS